MKNYKWRIISGCAAIVLLAVVGAGSYRSLVEIDLSSGMIRTVTKMFWITMHRSSPEETTLSRAITRSPVPPKWLVIAEEGFSFPRARIDFCYPRMLFWAGGIDRSFHNAKVSDLTAQLALSELSTTHDICLLTRHLKRYWEGLADTYEESWTEPMIASEIPRIWKITTNESVALGEGNQPMTPKTR